MVRGDTNHGEEIGLRGHLTWQRMDSEDRSHDEEKIPLDAYY